MKFTFLGTGTSQGIPIIGSTHPVCLSEDLKDKRLRVSAMVEIDNLRIIIDCGPDFRQQMLKHKVSSINAVLFTHEHADHTAGLDDLRPFFFKQGSLHTYMTHRVHEALKSRFSYIFTVKDKYPGVADLTVHQFGEKPFMVDGLEILPIKADHGFLPVHGFRIKNLAYMTDVKTLSDQSIANLKNLEILVINCLREKEHPTHLNLKEALELIKILKPKKTYFTHISHEFGFHKEVERHLPENVFMAYDNLKLEL